MSKDKTRHPDGEIQSMIELALEHGPLTTKQIAEKTRLPATSVYAKVLQMVRDGLLVANDSVRYTRPHRGPSEFRFRLVSQPRQPQRFILDVPIPQLQKISGVRAGEKIVGCEMDAQSGAIRLCVETP